MFYRFKQTLARFFYGRYGADSLYNASFILALILLFVSTVLNLLGKVEPVLAVVALVLYLVSMGLMFWAMFRFFSRKIAKRRQENEAWLLFKGRFRRRKHRRSCPNLPPDTADHIFRVCPRCHSTLRLPRTPGKHEVKCPRCGDRFGVKVKK